MNELLVLHRADFYGFCAALGGFPDWAKVQEWIRDNEILAPPDLPTVEDTIRESVVGPAELSAKLDTILAAVQQLAVIGQVFEQFGAMVGAGSPALPSIPGPGSNGAINFLGNRS